MYSYDPWGVQTLTAGGTGSGAHQNPYAFHGGIKHPGSGLVKFGLRWYSPTTGAWTQEDTLDAPLDPANANRYAYAGDDPINNLDPGGLSALGNYLNFLFAGYFAAAIGAIVSITCLGLGGFLTPETLGASDAAAAFLCGGLGALVGGAIGSQIRGPF